MPIPKCPKYNIKMEELEQDYDDMTEGQQADLIKKSVYNSGDSK